MKIEKKEFIWLSEGFITDKQCDELIGIYKTKSKNDHLFDRFSSEGAPTNIKSDTTLSLNSQTILDNDWNSIVKPLVINLQTVTKQYLDFYGFNTLMNNSTPFYDLIKIQKTLPGEGYHVFHIEKGNTYSIANRFLAWTLYLNDVDEGGETEFLHQKVRVKPKKGLFAVWPAGFPFVHRGNPPLSGEKYIATSWVRFPYQEDSINSF